MKKYLFFIISAFLLFSCGEKISNEGKDDTDKPEAPKGSETNPYIITEAAQFAEIRELLQPSTTTYIQLGADIDMKGVADYKPLNIADPYDKQIHFDGKNHTISNFACNDDSSAYPSLFGVLYGSCRNLKLDNVTITSKGQVCGVIGGYVGTADKPGTVENVTITNAVVASESARAGGVCGNAKEADFVNVSFQGTVSSTITDAEAKSGGFVGQVESSATFKDCSSDVILTVKQADAGGFAGKVMGTATFTGCKAKAVVTSYAAQKNRVGGFIGWNSSVKTVLTDCHVLQGSSLTDKSGRTTTASNGNYGGFIGFGDTDGTVLEISGCSATADIDAGVSHYNSCFISYLGYKSVTTIKDSYARGDVKSQVGNQVGGLLGNLHANASVTMTNCSYSGNISATGSYVGGIAGGVSGKMVLSMVSSSGTITSLGNYTGGLIGASMNDAVTITNCFSTAKVNAWGQQAGGLVGTTTNKLTMSDSYASGDVYSTTSGAAGLVGRVQKSSSITNCIAWNKNVATSRWANNVYAPGAVLGCAQEKGTYSKCWRRYDMVLTDDFMVLSDQEDFVDAMPPLPAYSTASHQQAYHGKAAPQGATLASVAKSLGWDEKVWNFASEGSTLGFTIKQLGDNKIEF